MFRTVNRWRARKGPRELDVKQVFLVMDTKSGRALSVHRSKSAARKVLSVGNACERGRYTLEVSEGMAPCGQEHSGLCDLQCEIDRDARTAVRS